MRAGIRPAAATGVTRLLCAACTGFVRVLPPSYTPGVPDPEAARAAAELIAHGREAHGWRAAA